MNTFTDLPPTIRVLLVDDHPTLLWGLERLIDSQAPRMRAVATAGTAEAALPGARRHRPDLVLLDLDLGGHSALPLLPQLAALGLQVLVLTGERNPAVLDQAVHLGARGIVRKDAPAELLLKAVDRVHAGELWLDRLTLGRVLHGLVDTGGANRPSPEQQKQAALTLRERKIIHVVLDGQGASNKALAARLFISEHTLRNHLSSIYHKLGVGNRLELYVYAVKHQLGEPAQPAQGLAA